MSTKRSAGFGLVFLGGCFMILDGVQQQLLQRTSPRWRQPCPAPAPVRRARAAARPRARRVPARSWVAPAPRSPRARWAPAARAAGRPLPAPAVRAARPPERANSARPARPTRTAAQPHSSASSRPTLSRRKARAAWAMGSARSIAPPARRPCAPLGGICIAIDIAADGTTVSKANCFEACKHRSADGGSGLQVPRSTGRGVRAG